VARAAGAAVACRALARVTMTGKLALARAAAFGVRAPARAAGAAWRPGPAVLGVLALAEVIDDAAGLAHPVGAAGRV